jgi:hypothetical protein
MKTIIKVTAIFGLISLMISGCRKEEYGNMTVKMTDAPGDYRQVNVDVRQVEIHYTNSSGWITLATNSGVYDLLTLQNNVTTLLATGTHIPAGRVDQMRLLLGNNNTVMLRDSTIHELKIPSSEQSGVKINVGAVIPSGRVIIITLDYDADRSVNMEGNGDYIMKPVISVQSIN